MSVEFGKPQAWLYHCKSSFQLRDGPQNMYVLQEEVFLLPYPSSVLPIGRDAVIAVTEPKTQCVQVLSLLGNH